MLVVNCFCYLQSFEFQADIYSMCFQGIKVDSQNKVNADVDTVGLKSFAVVKREKIGKEEFR